MSALATPTDWQVIPEFKPHNLHCSLPSLEGYGSHRAVSDESLEHGQHLSPIERFANNENRSLAIRNS